jgi:hypothetical protein
MSTPEQIAKLPKWAQNEINGLQYAVEYYKKQLVAVHEGTTNVFVERGLKEEDIPLPPNTRIRYQLGPRWDDFISVSIPRDEDQKFYGSHVYISSIGGPLSLLPEVSNVVRAVMLDRTSRGSKK